MPLNALTPDFLAALDAQLGPKALRPVDVRYLEEPRGRWAGQAGAVVENLDIAIRDQLIAADDRDIVGHQRGGTLCAKKRRQAEEKDNQKTH